MKTVQTDGLRISQRRPIQVFLGIWGLLLAYLAPAQPLTREALTGRWIGVAIEYDLDRVCPLVAYMDLRPDSTWQLGRLDNTDEPRTGTWALTGPVLRLDTTHYAPGLVTLQGNQLRIGQVVPLTFRRFRAVPMDKQVVWQRLTGQVWQSDRVEYLFAADGRVGLRNRQTRTQTAHYAQLIELDGSVFLLIRGSAGQQSGDVRECWQVMSNEVGTIRLVGSSGPDSCHETLRWVRALGSGESLGPTGFQTCANCMRANFGTFSVNPASLRKTTALLRQQYKPVDVPDATGLIRVSFVQNCQGERGPLQFQEYSADYKRRLFDKRITDQLRMLINSQLPGSLFSDPDRQYDIDVSLTIRLSNGQITDVF